MRQISLSGLLEFTAGCGFLFAIGWGGSFALYGFVFAVLAVWSLRIQHWEWRLAWCNWLSACSAVLFGVACLERAFLDAEPANFDLNLWLWCGFSLIVTAPLAVINGCLFAVDAWTQPSARRSNY